MEEAPTIAPPDVARPCVRCGYDLRSHDERGRCPECGLDAYWSLRAPQTLSQYPARWVTSMSRAVRLLFIAYAVVFLTCIEGVMLDVLRDTAIVGIVSLAAILQTIGMWTLSRWSGVSLEPRAPINRWALRLTPLCILGAIACARFMTMNYPGQVAIVAIGMAAGSFAPTAVFIRLRAVGRMLSDAGLAEHSTIVGWGCFFTAMVTISTILVSNFLTFEIGKVASLLCACAIAVAILLFLLWGTVIFLACVVDFGRAARIARTQWKTEAPPL